MLKVLRVEVHTQGGGGEETALGKDHFFATTFSRPWPLERA